MRKKTFWLRSTYPPFPYDLMCILEVKELEENNLGKERNKECALSRRLICYPQLSLGERWYMQVNSAAAAEVSVVLRQEAISM